MLSCAGEDAASLLIDFILNGERYVASADEYCGDPGLQAITEIHERLRLSIEHPN